MTLTKQQLYDGSSTAETSPMTLHAGPLQLLYDAGTIRQIRYGDVPVLHQVYAAVRDHNWGTVAGEIINHEVDVREKSFDIAYDMVHQSGDIDFTWHATITGDEDGTVRFTFDGVANSSFLRNRVGFCVLHPMSLAGQACQVEHVDGSQEAGQFPDLISPHQPFFDIRAISHEVVPGVTARVLMEGDTFEMEDQRNWIDASYKTYCTPLGLPFPVRLNPGDRISQVITISLTGDGEADASSQDVAQGIQITPSQTVAPLCDIGLALPSHGETPTDVEIERLKRLNLSHLRGEVRLYQADAGAQLRYAVDYASAIGTALELVVFLSDDAASELQQLADKLNVTQADLSRIVIFHRDEISTSKGWVEMARKHLSQFNVPIGAGTDAFFTELNRNRPPSDALDFVIYSVNPQVHAFDNLSLVETLAGHVPTIETAASFSEGKPIVISPVTFKMRRNPNATGEAPPTPPGQLPSQVDPRQMSLFGACWTLGSTKYCAEAGAVSATYYETTGWLGVMETQAGSSMPDKFASEAGTVFPMYHIFAAVGEFIGGEVVVANSSDPLTVETVWLRKNGQSRVIVANLSAEMQSVTLNNIRGQLKVRTLGEHNVLEAMRDPAAFWSSATEQSADGILSVDLSPYGITIVDSAE